MLFNRERVLFILCLLVDMSSGTDGMDWTKDCFVEETHDKPSNIEALPPELPSDMYLIF